MAVKRIHIDEFLSLAATYLVVDVRSPKEYQQAHYPGAFSLPLFTDEERKVVGTTYKQQSRQKAIKVGLDYYGPKMKTMVNQVEARLNKRAQKNVLVHCWRGGMRSAAVAWLLDLYGFKVYSLEGGYKAYRNWVLAQFEKPYTLRVLGGYTGSGKTEILQELSQNQHAVVDLEGIAQHKGSSFGNLDSHSQDSTEQFENKLAMRLLTLQQTRFKDKTIWVESESSRIGNINIPHKFFNQMKAAERINVNVPFDKRLEFILQGYGKFNTEALIAATKRIQKRLGGLRMQQTIQFIKEGNLKDAFAILLAYYDSAYSKSRQKFSDATLSVSLPDTNPQENAKIILQQLQKTV